jgi:CRISPR/Cas system-associated exonuclease Cas4 (RecB family)
MQRRLLPPKLSPRDIGDYRVCPRKVWYRRVAQVSDNHQNNATLMLGNAVHAALYLFFGLPVDRRDPVEARLHQCLRAVWRAHRAPGLFASRDAERATGQKGLELLSRYAQSFSTDIAPVLRERWVQVCLPNKVVLFGKADRVDAAEALAEHEEPAVDGAAAAKTAAHALDRSPVDVVDYKTGLRTIDEADLPDEPAAQIYLLGAQATLRRPVRRVRIAYLAHGIEARWEPEQDDVEVLRERLTDLTQRMISDQTFDPQPGAHCMQCAYADCCPDAGRIEPGDLTRLEPAVNF